MKLRQIAGCTVIGLLPCLAGGCELVLGELPQATDLTASSSLSTSTGGAGHGAGGSSSTTTGSGGKTGGGGTGGTITTAASTGGFDSTTTTGSGGCCDCDGDLQLAEGFCGGTDCDDSNKEVYKDAPKYYTYKTPAGSFDWDCSGVADVNPQLNVAIDCASLIGIGCTTDKGFLGTTVPSCGEPGDWGTCLKDGLNCTPQLIEAAKKMSCK